MKSLEVLEATDQSHRSEPLNHTAQLLPDASIPKLEEVSAEQLRLLHSASSGALVPLFYTGFMHTWKLFVVEAVIFLSPIWLPLIIKYFPGSLVSDAGPFLGSLIFILVMYLFVLPVKVILGKRLAWKGHSWASFDQFLSAQKRWDVAGRVVLVVSSLCIGGVLATSVWINMTSSPTYLPTLQPTDSSATGSPGTGRYFGDGSPIPFN